MILYERCVRRSVSWCLTVNVQPLLLELSKFCKPLACFLSLGLVSSATPSNSRSELQDEQSLPQPKSGAPDPTACSPQSKAVLTTSRLAAKAVLSYHDFAEEALLVESMHTP